MKAEVKLGRKKDQPFRAGVWLNESDCQFIIERLPKSSFFRTELTDKLNVAKLDAAKQKAEYIANRDDDILV